MSIQTVKTAYQNLLDDGYIYSRPCSGYYVCNDKAWEEKRPQSEPIKYIFSPNGIETSKLPYAKWSYFIRNAMRENPELFRPGDKEGEWCLRKSVKRMLYRTQGIECSTNQIIIGAGKYDLLRNVFYVLGRDKKTVLSNYCDFPIKGCLDYIGGTTSYINEDKNGIHTDELDGLKSAVLYVSPSCNITTCATIGICDREKIAAWSKNGNYTIEDAYDSDYQYGEKLPPLYKINNGQNIIYIGEFAQIISPAMKIGYIILPHELTGVWLDKLRPYSSKVSRVEQVALSKFIDCGVYEKHVEYMRSVYKSKIDTLLDSLGKSQIGEHADVWGTGSGAICGVHFDLSVSQSEARNLLLNEGVKISTIGVTRIGELPPSFPENSYRIGLGHMKSSDIRDAVKRWNYCWKDLLN